MCPSGSWCPGGSVINSCPKGKTSNSGAKGESDCWDPTSVTAGATCDAGTYYDGNYGCLSCPGGFYCPGGTYSHSKGDINGSGRFKCPSEKPDSDANSSNLSDCKAGLGALEPVNPIGGDEPSGVEDDFVFCAKGKYYAGQGSCSNCLVGSYCPGGLFKASAVSGGIYACPANATCPAGSGDFVCNESAGYVKSGDTCVKKTSTNCIAGKYKINGSCQDCPIGNFYCPGDNIIYGCPEGADCTSTGFTCNESKGYVKSGNTCVKKSDAYCNEGFYPKKDEATGNVSCALCPSGSWCPGGSVINSCPKGKTSNSGAKGESDCWDPTSVTAGATCDAGTYYDGNYGCLSCPGGFYCPGGTYSHSKGDINGSGRFKCPSGKPNSGANSSSLSDCKTGLGGGTSGGGTSGGGTSGGGTSGGGTSGGGTSGGRSDVITNPNTSTKTPLVIAVLGILSLGVGTFTYSSGKKEIDIEL